MSQSRSRGSTVEELLEKIIRSMEVITGQISIALQRRQECYEAHLAQINAREEVIRQMMGLNRPTNANVDNRNNRTYTLPQQGVSTPNGTYAIPRFNDRTYTASQGQGQSGYLGAESIPYGRTNPVSTSSAGYPNSQMSSAANQQRSRTNGDFTNTMQGFGSGIDPTNSSSPRISSSPNSTFSSGFTTNLDTNSSARLGGLTTDLPSSFNSTLYETDTQFSIDDMTYSRMNTSSESPRDFSSTGTNWASTNTNQFSPAPGYGQSTSYGNSTSPRTMTTPEGLSLIRNNTHGPVIPLIFEDSRSCNSSTLNTPFNSTFGNPPTNANVDNRNNRTTIFPQQGVPNPNGTRMIPPFNDRTYTVSQRQGRTNPVSNSSAGYPNSQMSSAANQQRSRANGDFTNTMQGFGSGIDPTNNSSLRISSSPNSTFSSGFTTNLDNSSARSGGFTTGILSSSNSTLCEINTEFTIEDMSDMTDSRMNTSSRSPRDFSSTGTNGISTNTNADTSNSSGCTNCGSTCHLHCPECGSLFRIRAHQSHGINCTRSSPFNSSNITCTSYTSGESSQNPRSSVLNNPSVSSNYATSSDNHEGSSFTTNGREHTFRPVVNYSTCEPHIPELIKRPDLLKNININSEAVVESRQHFQNIKLESKNVTPRKRTTRSKTRSSKNLNIGKHAKPNVSQMGITKLKPTQSQELLQSKSTDDLSKPIKKGSQLHEPEMFSLGKVHRNSPMGIIPLKGVPIKSESKASFHSEAFSYSSDHEFLSNAEPRIKSPFLNLVSSQRDIISLTESSESDNLLIRSNENLDCLAAAGSENKFTIQRECFSPTCIGELDELDEDNNNSYWTWNMLDLLRRIQYY